MTSIQKFLVAMMALMIAVSTSAQSAPSPVAATKRVLDQQDWALKRFTAEGMR
jgi:hypothetical protein